MTPIVLKALQGSIEKWEKIFAGAGKGEKPATQRKGPKIMMKDNAIKELQCEDVEQFVVFLIHKDGKAQLIANADSFVYGMAGAVILKHAGETM